MGGWKLEVFKMALYMAFPVSLFYLYNHPKFLETWIHEKREELHPPKDEKSKKLIKECIRDYHAKKEEQLFKAIEEEEKKKL